MSQKRSFSVERRSGLYITDFDKYRLLGILAERCRTSRNDRNSELWQRPQGVIIIIKITTSQVPEIFSRFWKIKPDLFAATGQESQFTAVKL